MTDKELLIASIVGIVGFIALTRYLKKQVKGTAGEEKFNKSWKTISIIFGIGMTIQIISLISGLLSD